MLKALSFNKREGYIVKKLLLIFCLLNLFAVSAFAHHGDHGDGGGANKRVKRTRVSKAVKTYRANEQSCEEFPELKELTHPNIKHDVDTGVSGDKAQKKRYEEYNSIPLGDVVGFILLDGRYVPIGLISSFIIGEKFLEDFSFEGEDNSVLKLSIGKTRAFELYNGDIVTLKSDIESVIFNEY
jgi:hypothetical protein